MREGPIRPAEMRPPLGPKGMSRRAIRAWYLVHKWTALTCTVFLLMLCITGLPLIFHHEIDDILSPPPTLASSTAPLSDLDSTVAAGLRTRPGNVPLYLSFDDEQPIRYVSGAPKPDAVEDFHLESLDARSNALLPEHGSKVMDILLEIHVDLMLGLKTELMLGFMGLLFVAAIVSGVVLYVPFMAKLSFGTLRAGRSRRLLRLDQHNFLGIVTLAWAVVVGLTGTINTLALPLTAIWKADQLGHMEAGSAIPPQSARIPLQRAMDTALQAAPGTTPQFVAFPGTPYSTKTHYGIYLKGSTPLTAKLLQPAFVDVRTGVLEPLRPAPWYMKALLLSQPLHFGDYGGLPMKVLWALLDLLTIHVLWTGILLWLRRRTTTPDAMVAEVLAAGSASLEKERA